MTSPSRFVALGSFLVVLPLLAAVGCGDSGHDVGSTGAGGSAGAAGTAGAGRGGATSGSGGRGGDAAAGSGGATGGAIAGSGGGAGTGTGGTASGGRGGSGATGGAIAGSGGGAGRGGTGGGGGAGRGGTGGAAGGAGRGGAGGTGGGAGRGGAGGTGGTGGAVCGGSPGILCTVELVCDMDNPNKCGSGSVTGHCISLLGGCTADFNPVCGCDGRTFTNDCERAHARVQLDHAGACVPSSCASCNVATTYCQITMGGAVGNPPSYACPALPAACGATPSCACLPGCGGGCTTGAGGILTVTCLVP